MPDLRQARQRLGRTERLVDHPTHIDVDEIVAEPVDQSLELADHALTRSAANVR